MLTTNYTDYKVPLAFKNQLSTMILSKKSASSIFRAMITYLISDPEELGNYNADTMMARFPEIKGAFFGERFDCLIHKNHYLTFYLFKDFLVVNKQEFGLDKMRKTLTDQCGEARQKVWALNPEHEFTVANKTIKKQLKADRRDSEVQVLESTTAKAKASSTRKKRSLPLATSPLSTRQTSASKALSTSLNMPTPASTQVKTQKNS